VLGAEDLARRRGDVGTGSALGLNGWLGMFGSRFGRDGLSRHDVGSLARLPL